jgi:hypothetical protein
LPRKAATPAPRKRRRRRVGAIIAIALAFIVGIAVTAGADSVIWGAIAGLGAGGIGWGASLFFPDGEAALASLDDDQDGLGDDLGLGDS